MAVVAVPALVFIAGTNPHTPIQGLTAFNFPGLAGGDGFSTISSAKGEYLLSFDTNDISYICCSNVPGYQKTCITYTNQGTLPFAMTPASQSFSVQFDLESNQFVAPANVTVFVDILAGFPALPLQSCSINWGDGASTNLSSNALTALANGGTSANHVYSTARSYTLTCVITDSKSSQASATLQVTITPGAAPIPDVHVTASAVWFLVTATVSVLNPPPASEEAALTINWGDGSGNQRLNSNDIRVTYSYEKPGTYNISVELVFTAGAVLSSNIWPVTVTAPPLDYIEPLLLSSRPGSTGMAYVVPLLL